MFPRFLCFPWMLSATWLLAACGGVGLDRGGLVRGDLTHDHPGSLHIDLAAGQAVRLLIDQLDADLTLKVRVSHAGDSRVVDMRERGPESVTLIAEAATRYSIEVVIRDPGVRTARYEAHLEAPARPVTEREKHAVAAEALESAGKALATSPTASKAEAEDALRQAAVHWRAIGDETGMGTTAARLGDIQFSRGQFADAAAYYQDALERLTPIGQQYFVATLENNLGATFEQLGDFEQARRHFREASAIWATLPGAEVDHATAQSNEGTMHLRFGDYQTARQLFLQALQVMESNQRLNPAVLNNLGVVQRALGDLEAAAHYFQRTIDVLPPNHPRRADLRLRIAQVAFDRDDADAALTGSTAALAAVRSAGNPNPLGEAEALMLQGQAYAATGRYEDALRSLRESLAICQRVQARRHIATVSHHIGAVLRQRGQLADARSALGRALEFRQAIGLRDEEASTRHELGLLEAQAGHLDRAGSHLADAVDLIDGLRGRVMGEYSRATFLAARPRYFVSYVDVLMRQHERQPSGGFAARALEVVERQRARALIDLVRADGPVRDTAAQRTLDFWAGQVARLSNTTDADGERTARARMTDALVRLREVDGRLRTETSTGTAPASALPVAEIQRQLLDVRTRLVSYSLGELRSYVWVVAPDSIRVAVLPPAATIAAAADRMLTELRDAAGPQTYAAALAALIVEPIRPWLDADRLLVAADGALQSVPFAALPARADGSLLVDHHDVAMIPSATVVLSQRDRTARRLHTSTSIAVIADAVYEANDPRVRRRGGAAGRPTFGRLMLAGHEAAWVQKTSGPRNTVLMTGFEATKDAVRDRLGSHRIIHLAAHAVADNQWPELSGVALSMFDPSGKHHDGMLRLHEISTLNLQADLVVLSACQTAAGRNLQGEGVMGLARGFLGAGASAVVGSLDTVLEEPTFEFMKAFYSAMLRDGQSPVRALRSAQREMRSHPRFSHPWYWSQFVLIGDPQ